MAAGERMKVDWDMLRYWRDSPHVYDGARPHGCRKCGLHDGGQVHITEGRRKALLAEMQGQAKP